MIYILYPSQINQVTPRRSTFPLSLDGMSAATDSAYNTWAYISAVNVHGEEIKGWVSISSDGAAHQRAHVKRAASG